jgi:hypothetical protein
VSGLAEEGELDPAATIKSYLMVRTEGTRQVRGAVQHYNLEAILAVGFRVRSHRGTQFRKWANARLSEYLVKGFTMSFQGGQALRPILAELDSPLRSLRRCHEVADGVENRSELGVVLLL